MCHNFSRYEEVRLVDGMLCRYMFARKHGPEFLVAKVFEDGRQESRNIEYAGMFGWRFNEPGETTGRGKWKYTIEVDKWNDYTPSLQKFCWNAPSQKDKDEILGKYPEFRWVLAKTEWSTWQIFKALKIWKNGNAKEMETLCSMGCDDIALNGSFYMSKDKMGIIRFLSRNPEFIGCSLQDVRLAIRTGASIEEIRSYRLKDRRSCHVTYEEWRYLIGINESAYLYRDYIKMVVKAGHKLNDPYWHFPRNLKKSHDKVLKECRRIDRLLAEAEAEKRQNAYFSAVKKIAGKKLDESGISVYVPETVKDIEIQARKLNQCLLTCDYVGKVERNECVLVFIRKEGKPYATAEMRICGKGKYKLGQFYGDQHMKDYKAKPDAVEAFGQWAKKYKIKVA